MLGAVRSLVRAVHGMGHGLVYGCSMVAWIPYMRDEDMAGDRIAEGRGSVYRGCGLRMDERGLDDGRERAAECGGNEPLRFDRRTILIPPQPHNPTPSFLLA